jgi:hypothetical protein
VLSIWWNAFSRLYLEERIVIDVFLGAGLIYAILWAPIAIFGAWFLYTILGIAIVVMVLNLLRGGPSKALSRVRSRLERSLALPRCLSLAGIAMLSMVVLVLEASVALTQPAGNTLDGANATLSTALLITHGHFVTNLLPYANYPLYQPQGVTTWFASSRVLLGLSSWASANETAPILVVLSIPAAAAVGRRWLGGEAAPVVFAALFALLFSWPRMMVQGTYDFVASVPLALLLLPWAAFIILGKGPAAKVSPLPVACLLGMLGVSYSPVPLEAIAAGLIVGSVLLIIARPSAWSAGFRRLGRCMAVPIVAAVGILPSLWLIVTHTNTVAATSAASQGHVLVTGDLPTMLDPFLFGTSWISPFDSLHYEFLVMLLIGVAMLLFGTMWTNSDEERKAIAILVPSVCGALLILVVMAMSGGKGILFSLTNASELAIFFIIVEGLLVALPVAYASNWILERRPKRNGIEQPDRTSEKGRFAGVVARSTLTVSVLAVLVLASFAYPIMVTSLDLGGHLDSEVALVSNVTQGDISTMQYLSTLPGGPVLVAPGSAGEFLPAFCGDPLVFPLVGIGGGMGFAAGYENGSFTIPFAGPSSNSTYLAVVAELVNGKLTSHFAADMSILQVEYILVTGNSTGLFPPFQPGPLLADPAEFSLLFHSGDAYLFRYDIGRS